MNKSKVVHSARMLTAAQYVGRACEAKLLLHPCHNEDPGSGWNSDYHSRLCSAFNFYRSVVRLLPAGVRVVAGFDAEEDGALPYESS